MLWVILGRLFLLGVAHYIIKGVIRFFVANFKNLLKITLIFLFIIMLQIPGCMDKIIYHFSK